MEMFIGAPPMSTLSSQNGGEAGHPIPKELWLANF